MGAFATAIQTHLRAGLSERWPQLDWQTEYRIEGTPVDVAGVGESSLVLVELEWRRADPADNTAKLFRHLDSGSIDHEDVRVFQVFTRYYDLERGGHSSKRKNAEFVGTTAASTLPLLSYDSLDLDIDPPKRGGGRPDDWEEAADEVVTRILRRRSG